MISKIENKYPKITYLTTKGNRTPKEIWKDTETGITGMTKKDVIIHKDRLNRMGITMDMTDEEAREKARVYILQKAIK